MKKAIFAIAMVLTVLIVNARGKENKVINNTDNTASVALAGTITDVNSGESLVGVEVKIEGTDLKTYTDFDGNFSFSNVKPGECKVVATYISYQACAETTSNTSKENKLDMKLKPSK